MHFYARGNITVVLLPTLSPFFDTDDSTVPCSPPPSPPCCVQMAVALGGRIAEELIFGENEITTGASGDFQQVSRPHRMSQHICKLPLKGIIPHVYRCVCQDSQL